MKVKFEVSEIINKYEKRNMVLRKINKDFNALLFKYCLYRNKLRL
jgi:hypothetical protein